jgi:hypothetical protein
MGVDYETTWRHIVGVRFSSMTNVPCGAYFRQSGKQEQSEPLTSVARRVAVAEGGARLLAESDGSVLARLNCF